MDIKQRVKLVKEIHQRFVNTDIPYREVILSQLDINLEYPQDTESWSGNDYYSHEMKTLATLEDDILMTLYDILFDESEFTIDIIRNDQNLGLPFVEKSLFRLFSCYSSEKKDDVLDIKFRLKSYGIDCFVDEKDIPSNAEWQSEIERQLKNCHALAAYLTENSKLGDWASQEIGFCYGNGKTIIPIAYTRPYGFIAKYQGIVPNGKKNIDIANEIFNVLMNLTTTAPQMSSSIIYHIENSSSFAESKFSVPLLDKIKSENWQEDFSNRLELALLNNSQVSNAVGVTKKIISVIERHGSNNI